MLLFTPSSRAPSPKKSGDCIWVRGDHDLHCPLAHPEHHPHPQPQISPGICQQQGESGVCRGCFVRGRLSPSHPSMPPGGGGVTPAHSRNVCPAVLAIEEVGVLAPRQPSKGGVGLLAPLQLSRHLPCPASGHHHLASGTSHPLNQPHRSVGLELGNLGPERTPVRRCPPPPEQGPTGPQPATPRSETCRETGCRPPAVGGSAPPKPRIRPPQGEAATWPCQQEGGTRLAGSVAQSPPPRGV